MAEQERFIKYKFTFSEKREKEFRIKLDPKTLDLVTEPKKDVPVWTRLDNQQCENCPLDPRQHMHCPIAVNLVDVVDFFCMTPPSPDVHVEVETPERTYSKDVDFKSAVVSLLGVYMVTSGCPIMDRLRPMVRFHLPFATILETTYRSIANYLITQFLVAQTGKAPDWNLEKLGALYEDIDTVNRDFRERLREAGRKSYAQAAFINLDASVNYITMALSDANFYQVESLFHDGFSSPSAAEAPAETQPSLADEKVQTYQYQFRLAGDKTKEFTIRINDKSLKYVNSQTSGFPAWTELSCQKCPNCPLDESKHKYCPAATAVSDTIEFFRATCSIDEAEVTVRSPQRDYSVKTSVTSGITAMMGLVMASSGCPVVGRLKPMVRNHLPFATHDETAYRALGMYLLSQHFQAKAGKAPDWKLKNFMKIYEEINTVNKAFCKRLRESKIEDASLNALVRLDCFAQGFNYYVVDGKNDQLKQLFAKCMPTKS